ncbi:hypothetical protein BZG36_05192, partial [Bifiguratus adelaidae]
MPASSALPGNQEARQNEKSRKTSYDILMSAVGRTTDPSDYTMTSFNVTNKAPSTVVESMKAEGRYAPPLTEQAH